MPKRSKKVFESQLGFKMKIFAECCGMPMHFVGQIDDNDICTERPKDAILWWHDLASFYVFTCSQCLKCKAIGQQF